MSDSRPTSLHTNALVRGNGRSMHAGGLIFLAVLTLAGCATGPPACLTRTELQRVPVPVFIGIPEEFTKPLEVPPLPDDLSNRDLEADTRALEDQLDKAQADRAELRRVQQQRNQERERDQ